MKNALILFGNLRTFYMPLRQNPSKRVCDVLLENIVANNNFDIFISTDANDYFYNGDQIFFSNNIDIVNGNTFRLLDSIKILNKEESKNIVQNELFKTFGNSIKNIKINTEHCSYENDEKVKFLESSNCSGASPRMLVAQYKSLYDCYEMLTQYESQNNFKYDNIMKCRFDFLFNDQKLNLSNINVDVFVPGIRGPIIYDFFAYGKRNHMMPYLSLYENLGFMLPNKTFMIECRNDGSILDFGENPQNNKCKCGKDNIGKYDITIASEHHVYKTFEKNKTNYKLSNVNGYVYRYREADVNKNINDIIKANVNNANIFSHSPGNKSEKRSL